MGSGEKLLETTLTITFGEFVHAIFWEIGFHGTPADRGEVSETLRERAETLKRRREQQDR